MTFLRFLTFTVWNSYVLKFLHLETLTFSDVTLNDINVVWCYVLSQYRSDPVGFKNWWHRDIIIWWQSDVTNSWHTSTYVACWEGLKWRIKIRLLYEVTMRNWWEFLTLPFYPLTFWVRNFFHFCIKCFFKKFRIADWFGSIANLEVSRNIRNSLKNFEWLLLEN